jgi:UDP-2,3-diacylglucosamine hydrolase
MPSQPYTLFISDLHLDPSQPATTELFFYFLEHIAPGADALYILGDFFESYIGDDDCNNPFMQSVIHALSRAAESGLSIFFMHGNRDFLIGKSLLLHAGMTLLKDPSVITLYGRKTLLMHGDSLCTQDRAHQRFRKIVNNKIIQKIFLLLPLSFRKKLANQLRNESKKQNQYKSMAIMDVCDDTVQSEMKKYNVARLIHGHTHKPAIHALLNNAERIVLGAWHQHGNYLHINSDGCAELIDI